MYEEENVITPDRFKCMLANNNWEGKNLPENLVVSDSIHLSEHIVKSLPNGLVVYGALDLSRCKFISRLPDDLVVSGYINLFDSTITEIPDNLTVGGDFATGDNIRKLPRNLIVKTNFYFRGGSPEDLTDDVLVGGSIYFNNSATSISRPFNLQPQKILSWRNGKYIKCSISYFGKVIYRHGNIWKIQTRPDEDRYTYLAIMDNGRSFSNSSKTELLSQIHEYNEIKSRDDSWRFSIY